MLVYATQKPPLGTPINPSHPLSVGLVAQSLLNEGGGIKVREAVKGLFPGTITGTGSSWSRGGWFSGASSAYLDYGNQAGLYLANAFTIYIRFTRTAAYASNSFIAGDYTAAGSVSNYALRISATTHLFNFWWENPNSQIYNTVSNVAVPLNTVSTLAATWDGGTRFVYILSQGVRDVSSPNSNPQTHTDVGQNFAIGNAGSFVGTGAQGLYDCWGMYNRPLSLAELQRLHAEPYAMYTPPRRVFYRAPTAGVIHSRRSLSGRAGSRAVRAISRGI